MIEINRYVMHSKDCGDAFERMFWACFWGIDFRVGIHGLQVDLLPDLMGWMLMISAFGKILDLSPSVSKLRVLAWILLILSLFDIFTLEEGELPFTFVAYFWQWIPEVLLLILVWRLGGLIMAMAEAAGNDDLGSKARRYRPIYLVVFFLPVVTPWDWVLPAELVLLVGMAIMGLVIVMWLLIMKLLKDTATMCRRVR